MNSLPPEFVAYLQELVDRLRSVEAARRALLFWWGNGRALPGYPAPHGITPPRGWSRANLARHARRTLPSRPSAARDNSSIQTPTTPTTEKPTQEGTGTGV